MKPYTKPNKPKLSTQNHAGRHSRPIKGTNEDGEEIIDKTQFYESRPGAKEKIRNAKRSYKKGVRQILKKEMKKLNDETTN